MSDIDERKRALREEALNARDAVPVRERERKNARICVRLQEIAEGAASETGDEAPIVAVYRAMRSEADVSDFVDWAYGSGWRVAYPCMVKRGEGEAEDGARSEADGAQKLPIMRFRSVPHYLYDGSADVFFRHPLRSYSPSDAAVQACPVVAPHEITMMVVPLVAYDSRMARLGYGAGCYDRFLPQLRPEAAVCGVAFKEQEVLEVPVDEHDVVLPQLVVA